MHSTQSCLLLGLPNILFLLSPTPVFIHFSPHLSVLHVITWPKQTIPLTLATIQSCNFTNPPITSCTLWPNVLTTLLLNTLNVWRSLNMTDQHCNINKQQVKLDITFLNHCLHTDRQTKCTFHINWITYLLCSNLTLSCKMVTKFEVP